MTDLRDEIGRCSEKAYDSLTVLELYHFDCTSEDINSLVHGPMLKEAVNSAIVPLMDELMGAIYTMAKANAHVPVLFWIHEKHNFLHVGNECYLKKTNIFDSDVCDITRLISGPILALL
ncbi:adenylosuccinate lyase [Tanacetum coccineum]